jgi:ubiquinone/menaquinone biosynthesis C-methylase UbiE
LTWEEIIIQIRLDPVYKDLVELAYFEEDLPLNIERFRISEEYQETIKLIRSYSGKKEIISIVDIGAGNGVAAVSFALDGFQVTAVEPDPSNTIGAGAIKKLKEHYQLNNIQVVEAWGESLPLDTASYDVVYIRQAVHHAAHLNDFIKEAARLLKPGGMLITTRDHVIYSEADKKWFLETHPLHKFYGGENAFSEEEYGHAMIKAGLKIEKILHHYDSVINYFPEKNENFEIRSEERKNYIEQFWKKRIPAAFRKSQFLKTWYFNRANRNLGPVHDERKIPGRLISFIALKK